LLLAVAVAIGALLAGRVRRRSRGLPTVVATATLLVERWLGGPPAAEPCCANDSGGSPGGARE
jgi:hypothetical protein